ncbi:hypothetical protein CSUI_009022 [Cystoisospora suis]|uniref:Uncharacterized protein n=1 Tax=Cystoisospora suis TaxID=483139 RepID=A0A2C6KL86_9APIC|nr:hypothetical protein CSUI_009022 [Cystoisospora suis]
MKESSWLQANEEIKTRLRFFLPRTPSSLPPSIPTTRLRDGRLVEVFKFIRPNVGVSRSVPVGGPFPPHTLDMNMPIHDCNGIPPCVRKKFTIFHQVGGRTAETQ